MVNRQQVEKVLNDLTEEERNTLFKEAQVEVKNTSALVDKIIDWCNSDADVIGDLNDPWKDGELKAYLLAVSGII